MDTFDCRLLHIMDSSDSTKIGIQRPRPLVTSQTFPKFDSPRTVSHPHLTQLSGPDPDELKDCFLKKKLEDRIDDFDSASEDEAAKSIPAAPQKLPDDFDQIPIELISLSDRFIDSLSAKVYSTPPTVDKLSGLFQDFYAVAINHINTHISTISSLQNRQRSFEPPLSAISSTANKIREKAVSISSLDRPMSSGKSFLDQQMLTTEEINDRKGARKILEQKRIALEEAIEKRVCEGTYDRIWRHRSTHDEAKDEKLRSRTAALSLVGIGLKDLGVDIGVGDETGDSEAVKQREFQVRERLEGARQELIAMNDLKYPLGKLQHLKMAHKAIVDTLADFHPSSSADEIMPMLIYTLITSRPEGINIISNMNFIQRFRNECKMDGEASYCLTTLEAAICFLETVDLASLRADEKLSGPPKSASRPNTPSTGMFDPLLNPPTPSDASFPTSKATAAAPNSTMSATEPSTLRVQLATQAHRRHLSDLFHSNSTRSVTDDSVPITSDQGLEAIGTSLGDSYKFLLGKLKGRSDDGNDTKSESNAPQTLDDARRLVGTSMETEGLSSSSSSLYNSEVNETGNKLEDRLRSIISGLSPPRERTGECNRSAPFVESADKTPTQLQSLALSSPNPPLVESMRNLGNTLNPMSRIAGMGVMRAFGRATPPSTPTISAVTFTSAPTQTTRQRSDNCSNDLTTKIPDLLPALRPDGLADTSPPIPKFMELQNPGEMKINEVMELLRDYRRLAGILKELGAF
ncbi:BgTH12-01972 [Blumeria graminis f. sp. triticale]|uniref:Bgt-1754 n=3 Tax=Blumeria graminis TaxID=34373 RepID=A0A381LHW5_BLUGR|nr:hypothetical protein BGT96224_1754 [Blumeria graminis f. sp. tritici 96224]CAD6501722.1 BgTH12-01972 [Blumeria graminis f. sp. triticale]VDB84365.1 Bgt-1754 [Blumeria graminis f. sp. tritici]